MPKRKRVLVESEEEEEDELIQKRKRRKEEMTWKDAVVKVIRDKESALKVSDIADCIVREGYRKKTKTPHLTVSNIINTNMNSNGKVLFYREEQGVYGLTEWLSEEDKKKLHKKSQVKKKKKKKKKAPKKKKKRKKEVKEVVDEEEEEKSKEESEPEDLNKVNIEEVDENLIIMGKRRRKSVDYTKLHEGNISLEQFLKDAKTPPPKKLGN